MSQPHRPRRPLALQTRHLDRVTVPGQSDRIDAAHATAWAVVDRGRSGLAQQEVDRLLALGDGDGLDDLAELWSGSPADTLPGALWRLYLLRRWIAGDPRELARCYELGTSRAEVADAVAGVERPPGPAEMAALADAVLSGAVSADLDVALDRAGAFYAVVAAGTFAEVDELSPQDARERSEAARRLRRTAGELGKAAQLARSDSLS